MSTISNVAVPTLAATPDWGAKSGHRLPTRTLLGIAGTGLLAAALLAVLMLDPFAPPNTHPTPEMLAAWEEMMRDG